MELRLLIVEDDRLLAEAVSDYFTAKGWKTKIVYNGKDAAERAVNGSWQMILLDVMLPGRDGFSVCRKIREQTDTPIFFITARVMEEDELNGYAAGADDYITKPFSLPVLYAKVMAMTGRVRGSSLADLDGTCERVIPCGSGSQRQRDSESAYPECHCPGIRLPACA